MYKLVLLRHGESEWNLENRFTGWTDVDLTKKGEMEARLSGQLLTNLMWCIRLFWCGPFAPWKSA